MGTEIALQALNRKFGEFVFRALGVNHVLAIYLGIFLEKAAPYGEYMPSSIHS